MHEVHGLQGRRTQELLQRISSYINTQITTRKSVATEANVLAKHGSGCHTADRLQEQLKMSNNIPLRPSSAMDFCVDIIICKKDPLIHVPIPISSTGFWASHD